MQRSEAIKKLSRMLGKGFGYRVDADAPNAEERAEALAQLPAAQAERNKLKARRDEIYAELMKNAEYQAAHAAYKKADEHANRLSWRAHHHYKITVGIANSMFFHQKAQGDSWEEVIAKIKN